MTVVGCPKCGGGAEFDNSSDPKMHWHNGKIHVQITVRIRCYKCGWDKLGYIDEPVKWFGKKKKSQIPVTTEAFHL